MISAYFKKLASSLFFIFIYFLFIMGVAFVWTQIAVACRDNLGMPFDKTFNYFMSAILTLLIELIAVYFVRIDSLNAKDVYEETHAPGSYSFKVDFKETLKSKDHILHTAAFNTLMLPLFLLIGMGFKLTGIPLFFGAIAMTIVSILLFSVISTLVWCIVHKNWLSTKDPKDLKKLWNAIVNRLKGWS